MVAIAKRLVPAQKISLLQREHFKATHDPVTGLLNQVALDEYLDQQIKISARYKRSFALIMIELDPENELASSQSKTTANIILLDFAQRIKNCVRSTDTIARIENNVFSIVLPDITESRNIIKVVDSINFQLLQPFTVNERQYYVSAAMGIDIFPDDNKTRKSLVEHAYIAMCQSKKAEGRNYCFYDDEMDEKISNHLQTEEFIRRAINHQEYDIHYMPINRTVGNGFAMLQAEVVWHAEQLRLMEHQAVVEHIDALEMSLLFGDVQLNNICQKIRQWKYDSEYDNKPVLLEINEIQFNDRKLADRFVKITDSFSVSPQNIGLLIKEELILHDVEFAVCQIAALKKLGFKIVIDQFSCGLSYIGRFAHGLLDMIRLEGNMVVNMNDQIEWLCVIEGIIRIAEQLNIKTVVTGIDSEYQYKTLVNVNADYWQGSYALMLSNDNFQDLASFPLDIYNRAIV